MDKIQVDLMCTYVHLLNTVQFKSEAGSKVDYLECENGLKYSKYRKKKKT